MIRVVIIPDSARKRRTGRPSLAQTRELWARRVFQGIFSALVKQASGRVHWELIKALSEEFDAVPLREPREAVDYIQREERRLRRRLAADRLRVWKTIQRFAIQAENCPTDLGHNSIPWRRLRGKFEEFTEFDRNRGRKMAELMDGLAGQPRIVDLPQPPASNTDMWNWYYTCLEAGTAQRVM